MNGCPLVRPYIYFPNLVMVSRVGGCSFWRTGCQSNKDFVPCHLAVPGVSPQMCLVHAKLPVSLVCDHAADSHVSEFRFCDASL